MGDNVVDDVVACRVRLRLDRRLGFAQFDDGKPAEEAVHKTCFPYHET
jgi:hypothetical protein